MFPLIFWFLIMTFNLRFYHQLWVKLICMHIGNNSGHIEQTYLRFPKCLWIFDIEWNAHQIGILDNLFDKRQLHQHIINTSACSKKKKNSTVYSTFNKFCAAQQKVQFIGNLSLKSLTCFKHKINMTVVFLLQRNFLQVLINVLCAWSI